MSLFGNGLMASFSFFEDGPQGTRKTYIIIIE